MSQMLREVEEAAARVASVLARDFSSLGARLRALDPAFVAVVARGSSAHAAEYARHLIPSLVGRLVVPVPTSVSGVTAPVTIAVSQGGGSPDILRTLTSLGGLRIALVNVVDSPLARAAEVVVDQGAGPELSLAATKSVLCSMACLEGVAAAWAGVSVTPVEWAPLELGEVADHVVVLGRGLTMCVALELALKLKETCGAHAEAFSAAEVLHGPREMVDSRFLVIAIGSACNEAASALESQGARVVRVDCHSPIGTLYGLYGWVARAAVAMGRDPDKPRHLPGKIIQTA